MGEYCRRALLLFEIELLKGVTKVIVFVRIFCNGIKFE